MPTRFVTLMNPRPRRRRRSSVTRNARGRFVRTHRNPSRRVRRSRVRRTFRARRRRVHRNPSHISTAVRRKISLSLRRRNRSRSVSVVRRTFSAPARRHRRSSMRRSGGFSGGSLLGSFKSALSKPLLMKAGGAVVASFGTGYIMNRWGASLPLANNQYGRVLYLLGIPVTAAYLVRRKSPALAEGLVIGGLVMAVNTLMQGFRAATVTAPAAVGSYAVAGELGNGSFGYYPQSPNDTASLGGGNAAFPASAW